jgi:hypothetical protein
LVLSELDGDTKIGLDDAEITFTGSGAKHLDGSSVTTSNSGEFTITGKAPDKEGKWKVQAHFVGDAFCIIRPYYQITIYYTLEREHRIAFSFLKISTRHHANERNDT